jgi:glucose-6-phosphate 1-dehydrogenase
MSTTQVNITAEAMKASQNLVRRPDPSIVVIFGASGDLTKRKLLPALYHLQQSGFLPDDLAVLGVARRALEDTFAPDMKEGIVGGGGVDENDPKLAPFMERVQYYAMNFDDDAAYDGLKKKLAEMDEKFNTKGNRLFYLAVAPEYFSDIIGFLGKHEMNVSPEGPSHFVRTIIEKPFGHDLASARALND